MQVNPEDGPPEIVTWSDPRMTYFEFENPGA